MTSQDVDITLTSADALDEDDKYFFLILSNPTPLGPARLGDFNATGTIQDDDPLPTFSFSSGPDITEGATLNATFTLSAPSGRTCSFKVSTGDDTATGGVDYTSFAGTTVTFLPGETVQYLAVTTLADTTFEDDETFTLDYSAPTNLGMGASTVLTILNDDPYPTISITPTLSLAEGNSGTVDAVLTVTLSNPSAFDINFEYSTADVTATAGSDYVAAVAEPLTFAAGETSKPITILVNGDAVPEPNETFTVTVDNVDTNDDSDSSTVTITNDDGMPAISIDSVTLTEGDADTKDFVFTVTLDKAAGTEVRVDYATTQGTATSPSDYTAVSGTLVFAPGETSLPVTVEVNGDTTAEANEVFNVDLTAPVFATITTSRGVGTITNDDPQPIVSFQAGTATVAEGTATLSVTVELSYAHQVAVTVPFTAQGVTATGTYSSLVVVMIVVVVFLVIIHRSDRNRIIIIIIIII